MRLPLLRRIVLAIVPLAALAAAPASAGAQRVAAFSLSAGLLAYDLDQSGETLALAVRAEIPYSSLVMIEAGVMVARPELENGHRVLFLPQTLLQLRIPAGSGVEPYLGGGAGLAIGFEDAGGNDLDVLLTGAAGVRIDSGGLLGFVIDGRVHAIGFDADAHLLELTLGVRIRR